VRVTNKLLIMCVKGLIGVLLGVALAGCVKDREFEMPVLDCMSRDMVNTTYQEVKALYQGQTTVIHEELVIEGVVISSDEAGNFFGSLHFQEAAAEAREGFQLDMDLRDAHLFYPVGSRIILRLKGLYLGMSGGVYILGGVFTAFGNLSVGRLPAAAIAGHLFPGCEGAGMPDPVTIPVNGLNDTILNTLVRLEQMEFTEELAGEPYALPEEETVRTLQDCHGNRVDLLNSGYSDFRDLPLPDGNGSITGVLHKARNRYQLIIRNTPDIDFSGGRCKDTPPATGSGNIFISELADPDNNPDARFVELFYTGEAALNLNGWRLMRYTNANTAVGSVIELAGLQILPNTAMVIAANAAAFETAYGFPPHLEGGSGGPADSNGDDNLILSDPSGTVVDVFGIIGEDGSGTNHEFEDGLALRREFVTAGNPQYTFSEWEIYNDTGAAGTVNRPQLAPDNFSPGIH